MPDADATVRPMSGADWPAVADIYAAGISGGSATFETSVPPREEWEAEHISDHRFVAELGGEVVGWAACSPVSDRCAHAGVFEVSVYVDPAAQGRGVGSRLLAALIASTEDAGAWTLQAGVFGENTASLALHARHGFRVVGIRERLGRLGGAWRDVILLERRSAVVGV